MVEMLTRSKPLSSYNPLPRDCVLYLPFWSPDLKGSKFRTEDFYRWLCTATGTSHPSDARTFNGSNEYVTVNDYNGANYVVTPPTGERSMFAWVKIPATSTYQTILDNCDLSGANHGHTLGMTNAGLLYVYHSDGAANINTIGSGNAHIDDNIWHLVGFTWTGTTSGNGVKQYVDENLDYQTAAIRNCSASADYNLRIGAGAVTPLNDFIGSIGEVWAWHRVLTAAQIEFLRLRTRGRYF